MNAHRYAKGLSRTLEGANARRGRGLRAAVCLCTAVLGAAAAVQAETIDFATLSYGSAHVEDGFVLATDNVFMPWLFSGNRCMFVGATNQTNTLQLATGSAFDLVSIDLSEQNEINLAQTIEFTGIRADGSKVTQMFTTDGTFGFETFEFKLDFRNLARVEWDQMSPECFLMYDNLIAAPSPLSTMSRCWGGMKALYSR